MPIKKLDMHKMLYQKRIAGRFSNPACKQESQLRESSEFNTRVFYFEQYEREKHLESADVSKQSGDSSKTRNVGENTCIR